MIGSKGPFHAAEETMHKAMMSAEGSTVDETWVRKMIAHHEGAIAMSQILLREGTDSAVRQMASKSIEEQTKDIDELNKLIGGR